MRIASYNLFEGAQNTYPLLQKFVKQEALDVICLQEANGWQNGSPSRLENFAAATGLTHFVYGNSNTPFKLATFSALPILDSHVCTEGLWHGATQTTIARGDLEVELWNFHADPQSEDARLAEVRLVAPMIGRRGLLVGDINSLSCNDRYPDTLPAELALMGITKFGVNSLHHDVTDYLTKAGLIDIAAARNSRDATVPTPANKDQQHAADLRLDYMFATRAIAARVSDIQVVKNELTNRISDHYPLVVTLG